jgi:DNA-binding CsgD family transcriptional regulator
MNRYDRHHARRRAHVDVPVRPPDGATSRSASARLLNLLQPHFVALYRAACVRRAADSARIVVVDPRRALETPNAEARRLLEAYDVDRGEVADWLATRPSAPLKVAGPPGTLVIDFESRGDTDVLVLTERPGPAPAELSSREHEVLDLVRDGLRNAETAEALSVSPGIVRKHLENIYEKLGVHTRTAEVAPRPRARLKIRRTTNVQPCRGRDRRPMRRLLPICLSALAALAARSLARADALIG